jgi:hypothetical protein
MHFPYFDTPQYAACTPRLIPSRVAANTRKKINVFFCKEPQELIRHDIDFLSKYLPMF